jgi:glycosyltransferase involved in cell wall biosynthesis
MDIKVSAIICTFNRAHYLRRALRSLLDQTLPKEQYEIIVVDNRSTDCTGQVVREEYGSVSNLRYLYEPISGLSQTRNTGWENAKGKYIAYIDDDAVADSSWLSKIIEAFETIKPQPGCIGGKVEPIWEEPRPAWLSDNLALYLAILDIWESPTVLDSSQHFVGANMAFPRCILEAVEGFPISLGRIGNNLLSNEETLLQWRLSKYGYVCFYHPEIIVKHHIQPSRLNKSWFMRRLYWQGISNAIYQLTRQPFSRSIRLRLMLSAFRGAVSPRCLFDLAIPTNNPQRFEHKCFAFGKFGYLIGLMRAEDNQ